ncbi:MAG: hypothetical protein ACYSSM_06230 [Planctomycetota bacterium]
MVFENNLGFTSFSETFFSMFGTSKDNLLTSGHKKIDAIYHNAEWLITAFASTLVFIIFVMQVYRIPTGSMAETLRGAHFRIRCAQCGLRYDHDFISERYGMKNTANPAKKMPIGPLPSRCPSCGYSEPKPIRSHDGKYYVMQDGRPKPAYARTIFKGDQIFVLTIISNAASAYRGNRCRLLTGMFLSTAASSESPRRCRKNSGWPSMIMITSPLVRMNPVLTDTPGSSRLRISEPRSGT